MNRARPLYHAPKWYWAEVGRASDDDHRSDLLELCYEGETTFEPQDERE